jgi:hypothetical protein
MKTARNLPKRWSLFPTAATTGRHTVVKSSVLIESDVQVYAMGIFDSNYRQAPPEERRGPQLLSELAEQSGGRHFPVDNLDDLPAIASG